MLYAGVLDVAPRAADARPRKRSSDERAMERGLRIELFGGCRVRYLNADVTGIRSPRQQILLARLVLRAGVPHSRAHLASLSWPDCLDSRARANLRQLVFELRRALPASGRFLRTDRASIRWLAEAPYTLDVGEFERAAAEGSSLLALERAAALYRGDLLPGHCDEWVLAERDRLRAVYARTLRCLIGALETSGDCAAAIHYAERLLANDPLEEEAYRLLMRLHAAAGNRAAAVRAYQRCATVLRRELDVAPEPATRKLYDRLLRE